MRKVIVFTGGGTAGHVTPNLALIEALDPTEWDIHYFGSENGVERSIIAAIAPQPRSGLQHQIIAQQPLGTFSPCPGRRENEGSDSEAVPYHAIKTGKLRRYFSWRTLLEPFFIVWGTIQAFYLLRRLKASIVFSKGGFVAFPVVVGAWLNHMPVIAHESDLTPGLANRLCFPFVKTICVTFAAGKAYFKNSDKVVVTGTPIRRALFEGNRARGLALCGFRDDKPCILVMGGSQGAQRINQVIRDALPQLNAHYQVIHLCGKGKRDLKLSHEPGYAQFEYVNEEMADLFAASDMVISRAGANSVYEILALQKPVIFIPLSMKVSRGDQIHNARHFEKQGIGQIIDEDDLTKERLLDVIQKVQGCSAEMVAAIQSLRIVSATDKIITLIRSVLRPD